jgi:UDP-N-acetylmuramoyl-L-alanyl-D-glutamate--2,6-diaminopimelate ligase
LIGVRLRELLGAAGGLHAQLVEARGNSCAEQIDIGAVVHNTADVVDGALYCCVAGSRVDGHDLAASAVAAGAVALLVDHRLRLPAPVPQLVVPDVRGAMGPLASAFWGHPSRQLTVVGVTGTAGKTTVTHLLCSVLRASGRPCSVIGTLSGAHTTPEATELQALLAGVRDTGQAAAAVEVSSHGLEMHRVDGTRFDVAVFTNLSRDHLDFHHTMDSYFDAKARLFGPAFTERAVVSRDDRWGRALAERVSLNGLELHTYSVDDARHVVVSSDGARFVWRNTPIHLVLTGRFNVANAVAAATAADAIGVEPDAIAAGLSGAEAVPGRFELVDEGQPFCVLVDYSHKPDALEHALLAGRDLAGRGGGMRGASGRLTVVFGCGGDKDAGKRPLMGAVAGRLADRVVVTSDNPRSEDPLDIINDIVSGMPPDAELRVESDRRRAIALAMREARPGDVVLIAGKGHEVTQTIGDRVVPFDDRSVARTALAEAGWR